MLYLLVKVKHGQNWNSFHCCAFYPVTPASHPESLNIESIWISERATGSRDGNPPYFFSHLRHFGLWASEKRNLLWDGRKEKVLGFTSKRLVPQCLARPEIRRQESKGCLGKTCSFICVELLKNGFKPALVHFKVAVRTFIFQEKCLPLKKVI